MQRETDFPDGPSRVVILGGTGFLGRALYKHLSDASIPCIAPTRVDLDLSGAGAVGQLRALCRSTDSFVVLAAITPGRDRGRSGLEVNLRMGLAVAEAVESIGPRHLVYLSSDAVYGPDPRIIDETTVAAPADLYGMAHRTRELLMMSAGPAPLAILRPTLLYGYGDPHGAYGPNRLVRMALNGRIDLFGDGEDVRDHLSVDVAAEIIKRVLLKGSSGILNLASGEAISYADLADMIAAAVPRRPTIGSLPRRQPASERRFKIDGLRRAFPDLVVPTLRDGVNKLIAQEIGASAQ